MKQMRACADCTCSEVSSGPDSVLVYHRCVLESCNLTPRANVLFNPSFVEFNSTTVELNATSRETMRAYILSFPWDKMKLPHGINTF